jgi:hypothetical protein
MSAAIANHRTAPFEGGAMFDVMKLVRGTTGVKVCQPVIAYYAL